MMNTRTLAASLSVLLLASMAMTPTGASEEQQTIRPGPAVLFATGSGVGTSDTNHEASCGGLAPLEPCTDSLLLPAQVEGLFLGASIDPYFTGWLVITLTTDPFHIEVTCEIIAGGLVAAVCGQTGGQGVLLGTEMVLDVDFDPIAVGQYEVSVWYE